jgi:hypothetical protein
VGYLRWTRFAGRVYHAIDRRVPVSVPGGVGHPYFEPGVTYCGRRVRFPFPIFDAPDLPKCRQCRARLTRSTV